MKTLIFLLIVLIVVLVVTFFNSRFYLRLKLDWMKDDLNTLPESEDVTTLLNDISKLPEFEFTRQEKQKAKELIGKSRELLQKSVPCYSENNTIPTLDQRLDPNFKCSRCNEKNWCVLH